MPWFKVDDSFWSHPKLSELSHEAVSLWVRAGAYCAQHLTDGFVAEGTVVRQLWTPLPVAGELVSAGLWTVVDGGFQFHDWLEYQPTAADTLAKREADRERKRKQRRNGRGQYVTEESHRDTPRPSAKSRTVPEPEPEPIDDDSLVIEVTTDRAREPSDWAAIPDEQRFAFAAIGVDGTAWVRALTTAGIRVRSPREAVEVAQWVLGKTIAEKENPTGYVLSALGRSRDEIADYVVGADLGAA